MTTSPTTKSQECGGHRTTHLCTSTFATRTNASKHNTQQNQQLHM